MRSTRPPPVAHACSLCCARRCISFPQPPRSLAPSIFDGGSRQNIQNFFASLFDDSRLVTILVPEWAGAVICWPEWRLMLTRQGCFALCSLCRTVRTLPKGRVCLLRKDSALPHRPITKATLDRGLSLCQRQYIYSASESTSAFKTPTNTHTSLSFCRSISAQHVSEANLCRDASQSMLNSVRTCECCWIC